MKLLCYVWIKFQRDKVLWSAARSSLAHAIAGLDNFFPGPYHPFSFVRDEELERRCYLHFFDLLYGCNHFNEKYPVHRRYRSQRKNRKWQPTQVVKRSILA